MTTFENHDEHGQRILFVDSRYYTLDQKEWYPGVTNILGVVDKGSQYKKWLQSNGFNADILGQQAMDQGSHVHEAIQDFLNGKEIMWATETGKKLYTRHEWILISRFIDFFKGFTPETLAVEKILVSKMLRYGSQVDYVCKIKDEIWLIDHKTGSYYEDANMQIAALRALWDEHFQNVKIDKCGILHLESAHRGRDKKGISIQGKGWKLIPCENPDKEFEDFRHVQAIWERKNPNYKPFNQIFPDRYSIESLKDVILFDEPDEE